MFDRRNAGSRLPGPLSRTPNTPTLAITPRIKIAASATDRNGESWGSTDRVVSKYDISKFYIESTREFCILLMIHDPFMA